MLLPFPSGISGDMNGALRGSILASLLPVLSCASPPVDQGYEPVYSDTSLWAPDWRGEPLSWAKLEEIEAWLIGPGPAHFPNRVPAAELELSEGRLELARRDAKNDAAGRRMLESRLASAEAGFRRVLSDPRASALEKSRAEAGLASLKGVEPAPKAAELPQVLARSSWGATAAVPSRMTSNRQNWKRITIHHSAVPSRNLGKASLPQVADTIRRIQLEHMRDRHWGDIGYHFLIDPQGRVFQGRSLDWQGAHAEGANNVANIGICLLGNFDRERPDPRALRALEQLVGSLCKKSSIPPSAVRGHEQYKATVCPGRYLMEWVRSYSGGGGVLSASAAKAPAKAPPKAHTGAAKMR